MLEIRLFASMLALIRCDSIRDVIYFDITASCLKLFSPFEIKSPRIQVSLEPLMSTDGLEVKILLLPFPRS